MSDQRDSIDIPAARIDEAIASRRRWATDTLQQWVRCDSVLGNERAAQELCASVLEALGMRVRFEPVDVDAIRGLDGFSPVDWSYDGRHNVVGLHEPPAGSRAGRSLIFNGHVDVVSAEPTALWSSPPYEPRLAVDEHGETWLYGRGAGDMKGGSLCHLWALAALRDLDVEPAAPVCVQSPIEEECTGNGTLALCAAGYRADGCVIPEPFDERVLVEQIGVLWFRVRVMGKTTHVLGAGSGVNAIDKAWRVVGALRELEAELNAPAERPATYRSADHPINLNVGVVQGGDWPSTVPGHCLVSLRLGFFDEQGLGPVMARVEARVREAAAADPWLRDNPPAVEWIGFQAEGCRVEQAGGAGDALVGAIDTAHAAHAGAPPGRLHATCTTDVRFFNRYYGVPAVCYGPRARGIHAADESVSVDSMQRVSATMARMVASWCGLAKRRRA